MISVTSEPLDSGRAIALNQWLNHPSKAELVAVLESEIVRLNHEASHLALTDPIKTLQEQNIPTSSAQKLIASSRLKICLEVLSEMTAGTIKIQTTSVSVTS